LALPLWCVRDNFSIKERMCRPRGKLAHAGLSVVAIKGQQPSAFLPRIDERTVAQMWGEDVMHGGGCG
jgi:hypothetical protein